MCSSLFVALLLSAGAAPRALRAQSWTAELQAGRLRHESDAGSPSATSVLLALRGSGAGAGVLAAIGIPTTASDPLWGSLGGWKRLGVRPSRVTAGADVSGQIFGLRHTVERPGLGGILPGSESSTSLYGFTGQVLPMIAVSARALRVEARAGGAHVTRSQRGSASQHRTLALGDVQATLTPTPAFGLTAQLSAYAPSEATYALINASAWISPMSTLTLWGTAGYWVRHPDTSERSPRAAGLLLGVTDRVAFLLSARRTAFDPLFQTESRTAWSLGMRYEFARRSVPAPVPARYEEGKATILLPVSTSTEPPRVAGDFNGWQPSPMVKSGNDWAYTVAVAPGVYNYAFVSSDGEWFVPESVPGRREDGMGGHVAVLIVR